MIPQTKKCAAGHEYSAGSGCGHCRAEREQERREAARGALAPRERPAVPAPIVVPPPAYALDAGQLARERAESLRRQEERGREAVEAAVARRRAIAADNGRRHCHDGAHHHGGAE